MLHIMTIEEYTINELTPYVCGEVGLPTKYLSGPELVKLFNQYGFRDVYTSPGIGLPKINRDSNLNTTRKDYARDRLKRLNGTNELKCILEHIINSADAPEDAKNGITSIITHDGYVVEMLDDAYFIIGGEINAPLPKENNVKFEDIEKQILINLEKAKVSIVVAVAWFTNQTLADKLKQKHQEGLNVEVVIFNDGINKKHCVDLGDIPVYRVRSDRGGIMHNKFCVIDNQIAGVGSYNWSNNAENKNDETFQFSKDPALATQYSVKFNELKSRVKQQ